MARTYVPTLVSQLRRLERYIERYDTVINDNVDPATITHINALLTTTKQILALEG